MSHASQTTIDFLVMLLSNPVLPVCYLCHFDILHFVMP